MKKMLMQLKITSPDKIIYEWEIQEILLPTEIGELKVVPWNTPMVTALKPWITKFKTQKDEISISIWKWMVFVDWKIVRIAVSSATIWKTNKKELNKEKERLEAQLRKLSINWSIEDIEKIQSQLAKINADIKLNY